MYIQSSWFNWNHVSEGIASTSCWGTFPCWPTRISPSFRKNLAWHRWEHRTVPSNNFHRWIRNFQWFMFSLLATIITKLDSNDIIVLDFRSTGLRWSLDCASKRESCALTEPDCCPVTANFCTRYPANPSYCHTILPPVPCNPTRIRIIRIRISSPRVWKIPWRNFGTKHQCYKNQKPNA